jgi:hypothetical protein
VKKFAFKEGIFEETAYSLKSHNCRHFTHAMAEFMGVGEKYLRVVKKEWFLACAIPLTTVKETVFQYEKDIEYANVVS